MRFWLPWACGAALWAAGMVLLSPHDLPITQALADRQAADALFVFYGGEVPGWICICLALFVLIRGRRKSPRLRPWVPAGDAVLIQALALPLAATQLLKLLWGRVRYIHLDADLANYTGFFSPAGVGAGKSFPSGHVAMAVVMAPLPFFLWRTGRRTAAVLSGAGVLAWGLFVSWGRVRAGSHYPTDCWFSFGLGLLVGAVLGRWAGRRAATLTSS